jgi:hypothetical protein
VHIDGNMATAIKRAPATCWSPFLRLEGGVQETRFCNSLASCGRSSGPLTSAFKCVRLKCV